MIIVIILIITGRTASSMLKYHYIAPLINLSSFFQPPPEGDGAEADVEDGGERRNLSLKMRRSAPPGLLCYVAYLKSALHFFSLCLPIHTHAHTHTHTHTHETTSLSLSKRPLSISLLSAVCLICMLVAGWSCDIINLPTLSLSPPF